MQGDRRVAIPGSRLSKLFSCVHVDGNSRSLTQLGYRGVRDSQVLLLQLVLRSRRGNNEDTNIQHIRGRGNDEYGRLQGEGRVDPVGIYTVHAACACANLEVFESQQRHGSIPFTFLSYRK